MSEPIGSTDGELFLSSLKTLQGGGSKSQAEQSKLLKKYGSAVDADVNVSASEKRNAALIPLLQTIPGVVLGGDVKEFVNDARHIIASSLAVRADIAYADSKHWVETGITFGQKPKIDFERVSDGVGIRAVLNFGENSKLLSGSISKTDRSFDGRRGSSIDGTISFDADGTIKSSSGDLEKFSEGTINIANLLTHITNPKELDKKIDFRKFIPLTS